MAAPTSCGSGSHSWRRPLPHTAIWPLPQSMSANARSRDLARAESQPGEQQNDGPDPRAMDVAEARGDQPLDVGRDEEAGHRRELPRREQRNRVLHTRRTLTRSAEEAKERADSHNDALRTPDSMR